MTCVAEKELLDINQDCCTKACGRATNRWRSPPEWRSVFYQLNFTLEKGSSSRLNASQIEELRSMVSWLPVVIFLSNIIKCYSETMRTCFASLYCIVFKYLYSAPQQP